MLNRRAAAQIGIIVMALVATGSTPTSLRAQNDPARQGGALPTADQILARYEQALGGAAALAKIITRITRTRRFQDVGSPEDHELVRFTKRPADPNARLLSIMSHSSLDGLFLRWSNGCDGKTGWNWSGRTDPSGIPRDATTITGGLCEERLAHYGYFPLDLARMKRNVQRFEVKGITYIFQPAALPVGAIAGGTGPDLVPAGSARETYLVLGVPHAGDGWHWLYFDTQTGVLLRFAAAGDGATPIPAGDTRRVVDYLQYRDVGNGTKASFQFVNQGPNSGGVTRVRGVHHSMEDNVPIDDTILMKPKNSLREDKGF